MNLAVVCSSMNPSAISAACHSPQRFATGAPGLASLAGAAAPPVLSCAARGKPDANQLSHGQRGWRPMYRERVMFHKNDLKVSAAWVTLDRLSGEPMYYSAQAHSFQPGAAMTASTLPCVHGLKPASPRGNFHALAGGCAP
jgi:hypothetical protein